MGEFIWKLAEIINSIISIIKKIGKILLAFIPLAGIIIFYRSLRRAEACSRCLENGNWMSCSDAGYIGLFFFIFIFPGAVLGTIILLYYMWRYHVI